MKRKQISFTVSDELHHEVKSAAIKRNMSMNLWITRALYKLLKEEKYYPTKENDGTTIRNKESI